MFCTHLLVEKLSIKRFLWGCLGLELFNPTLWYVIEIFLLYVLFYIIKRLHLNNYVWILLYCFWVILCMKLHIPGNWYVSTAAFLMGIYYKTCVKIVKTIMANPWMDICFGVIMFCSYCVFRYCYYNGISCTLLGFQVLSVSYLVLVPFFVFFVMRWAECFISNTIMKVLGQCSYYIYLYHYFVKFLLCRLVKSELIIVVGSLFGTIAIAIIIVEAKRWLKNDFVLLLIGNKIIEKGK